MIYSILIGYQSSSLHSNLKSGSTFFRTRRECIFKNLPFKVLRNTIGLILEIPISPTYYVFSDNKNRNLYTDVLSGKIRKHFTLNDSHEYLSSIINTAPKFTIYDISLSHINELKYFDILGYSKDDSRVVTRIHNSAHLIQKDFTTSSTELLIVDGVANYISAMWYYPQYRNHTILGTLN